MAADPYDAVPAEELYDLASRYARRHLDLGFFWGVIERLPAAEASVGQLDEAEADITRIVAHIDDLLDAGKGDVAEALRPYYLNYVREHGITP